MAPKFLRPAIWLGPVLEKLSFADQAELQRFLDLLMARINAANDYTSDADAMTERLDRMSAQERSEWAAGFTAFIESYPSAWPRRGRTGDDQRIIARLQASELGMDEALVKLLGAWLSLRRGRRV